MCRSHKGCDREQTPPLWSLRPDEGYRACKSEIPPGGKCPQTEQLPSVGLPPAAQGDLIPGSWACPYRHPLQGSPLPGRVDDGVDAWGLGLPEAVSLFMVVASGWWTGRWLGRRKAGLGTRTPHSRPCWGIAWMWVTYGPSTSFSFSEK